MHGAAKDAYTDASMAPRLLPVLLAAAATAAAATAAPARAAPAARTLLVVASSPATPPRRNDVLALLEADAPRQPFALRSFASLDEALAAAAPGDALLALADGSSAGWTNVSAAQWAALAAARLSGAYVEMPSTLPGDAATQYGPPTPAWYFDRVTARTDAIANLSELDILVAQGACFLNYPVLQYANDSALVYAHVAGSTHAVFGLPAPATLNPVLFSVAPGGAAAAAPPQVLVGAIALSCLRTCRYSPAQRWRAVWNYIIGSALGGDPYEAFPLWDALVAPSAASPAAALAAAGASLSALHALATAPAAAAAARATDWMLTGSGLLHWGDVDTCPAPHAPPGAQVACMLEGFSAKMDADGAQGLAGDARMDCSAESAMALALRAGAEAAAGRDATDYAFAAAALLNFTFLYSDAAQGHDNASDPSFGLIAWGVSSPSWAVCTYGDDNARVLVSALVASAALAALPGPTTAAVDSSAWDRMILKSVLGNLRIASAHGFRPGRIDYPGLTSWKALHGSNAVYANTSYPQPHYQTQMWAAFLLSFALTCPQGGGGGGGGCWAPLLELPRRGLEDTMAHYLASRAGGTQRWEWTEYASEEQGRLLLPLAWLLRAEALAAPGAPPNATHVAWLQGVAQDYLATQHASGGVLETLGPAGQCDACPPASNDAYGDGEAPIIAQTGEPLTDQLYGNNYALSSLVEAYRATLDAERFGAPAAKLAAYLSAIQVSASAEGDFAMLDGAWMRGFDVSTWEFGGAAADIGWGPWSIETGWSATWITAGLYTLAGNSSLYELATAPRASGAGGVNAALLAELCPLFFAGTDVACPTAAAAAP